MSEAGVGMSEASDKSAPDEAVPNRGRHREPPIIDAQANESKPLSAPSARGSRMAMSFACLALAGAGASLWFSFNARDTSANSEAAIALAQRLDRLERRVGALENKPAPVIPDNAPLAARIGSLDTKADRIAAEAARAAQLAEEALRKPAAEPHSDSSADLRAVEQRIAALEQRPSATLYDERNKGTAIALVAASLRQNLDRGAAFAREITALEKLGVDAKSLGQLKPLAAQGVPTLAKLAQDFSALSPALLRAAQPVPEGEDLIDRIGRSAASLVRIRPVGDSTQDNAPALIARIEAALQRNDLAEAITLFEKLPAPAQESARDWAQRARALAQADAATRNLIAQAIDIIAGK